MSKKINTLLFLLGATFFNILITTLILLALLFTYSRWIVPLLPADAIAWGLPVIFLGSIALSFVIYRIILKGLLKRLDMEKHFAPIFNSRKSRDRKIQE